MSKVVFVGAGPGDPELITVRGMKALKQADIVIYAGSLVPREVLNWAKAGTKMIDSAPLTLEQIVDVYKSAAGDDLTVIRLHSGDPGLFGAIQEQIDELIDLGIAYEIVPGVTAALATAAAAGRELTVPEISQAVILTRMGGRTPVPAAHDLDKLAATEATLCIYLSIHMIDKAATALMSHYDPETPVIVGHMVSRPEERIYETVLADLARTVNEAGIKSTAVVLVGRALRGRALRSNLYSERYSHGCRSRS